MSEYNKAVLDYLSSIGVTATIKPDANQACRHDCKPFSYSNRYGRRMVAHNHGHRYEISLVRFGKVLNLDGFWNSIDSRYNSLSLNVELPIGSIKASPDVYTMLNCFVMESYTNEMTFEEFCNDFGYDTDSRQAEAIYKESCQTGIKVKRFFSEDEINKLQELCQ